MQQTRNPMTDAQFIEYTNQLNDADRLERETTGKNFFRYGGGYSNAPVNDNSVQMVNPIHDDLTWYTPGEKRYYEKGTSGADETFMDPESYAEVGGIRSQLAMHEKNGTLGSPEAQKLLSDMHAIQSRAGYITDWDGSNYRTLASLGLTGQNGAARPGVIRPGVGGAANAGTSQQDLLNQWQQAAGQQAAGQIDYAVNQGVTELQRALEDAQALYKEQAEAVAKDEMQALDNSALYAEARGDKGGIGHSQYNEIQAAAAQNRLAVQQAQTKLSTDTARQIADLRAQGEFEKADKLLEVTQNYLSQLMNLEKWAAELGFSKEQFAESIREWQLEYELAVRKYDDSLATDKSNQTADLAWALLNNGIGITPEQMAATGLNQSQVNEWLMKAQLEQAAGNQAPAAEPTMSLATAKQAASKGVFSDAVLSVLRANGYDDEMLSAIYGYKPQGELIEPGNPALGLSSYAQQMAQALTESVFSSTADAAAYIQANLGKLDETEVGYLLSLIGY